MQKILAFAVALLVIRPGVLAVAETEDDLTDSLVPYIVISTHLVSPKSKRVPKNLAGLNTHEVVVAVGPSEEQKETLTRYTVVPGDPAEWVTKSWRDYEIKILVRLDVERRFARIIVSRDGTRLSDFCSHLNLRQPEPDPMDPSEFGRRLKYLETEVEYLSDKNRKLSDAIHRTQGAQFRPAPEHWLDANCALEDNKWGFTNEWVTRELDPDLIRVKYPIGINPSFDCQAQQFFEQWRDDDRLFAYATPARLQTRTSGEAGYIIVRDCRVVAKLRIVMS